MQATEAQTQAAAPSAKAVADGVKQVVERMERDGVLPLKDEKCRMMMARNAKKLREHLESLLAGRESVRDYAWLPEILLFYENEKKEAPVELAQQLLAAGADVNAKTQNGVTALFCVQGSTELCKLLLDAGAKVKFEKRCGTPLHAAARGNYSAVADMLIAAGVDVNAKDACGDTALHDMVCAKNEEMVRKLLAAGADIKLNDGCGNSPLSLALSAEAPAIAQLLLDAGVKPSGDNSLGVFAMACFIGKQPDVVRRCIEEGKAVNRTFSRGQTPLYLAACSGSAEVCRILLDAGAEASAEGPRGNTPLHAAAGANHAEVCKLLLQAGADVSAKNENGHTPLVVAVQQGAADAAKALVAAGGNLNARVGSKPILFYALNGEDDNRMLKELLAMGADLKGVARGSGNTALHMAAEKDYVSACKTLLAAGADLNARNSSGKTPLACAVEHGSQKVVEFLLDAGADVNMGVSAGAALVQQAMMWDRYDLAGIMLDKGVAANRKEEMMFLFSLAASKRNVDLCEKIIKSGLSLPKWPTLHLAALLGHTDELQKLLANGADVDEKYRGRTPLHYAAYMGHLEVCKMLIEAGVDVDEKDESGWTPLMAAVHAGHEDVVDLLLSVHANVKGRTSSGRTALIYAVRKEMPELARKLISAGAELNVKDCSKRTALHEAANLASYTLCTLLLENGAEVDPQDSNGASPLLLLLSSHSDYHLESPLCRKFTEAGADVNLKNKNGESPADISGKKDRCIFNFSLSFGDEFYIN